MDVGANLRRIGPEGGDLWPGIARRHEDYQRVKAEAQAQAT
jgi:hypothetical protein